MKVLANILSILFHPLLLVTYGVVIALYCTYLAVFPSAVKALLIGGAFFSTAFLPGLFIWILVKNGQASDYELTEKQQRVVPFLISIACVLGCTYYMYKMMMPTWFLALLGGCAVALLIAMIINFFWKISVHTLSAGCMLGGIMGVARIHLVNLYWAFIAVILIAGLVAMARIYLRKHTPMQVYAGFVLGFICTFAASLMNFIYLFVQ